MGLCNARLQQMEGNEKNNQTIDSHARCLRSLKKEKKKGTRMSRFGKSDERRASGTHWSTPRAKLHSRALASRVGFDCYREFLPVVRRGRW